MPSRKGNQFNNMVSGKNIASTPSSMRKYYKDNLRGCLEGNTLSKEMILKKLDIENRKLTVDYNAGKLSEEMTTSFIKGLEHFKNQGGEIIFTGGFDQDIMDIVSGSLTDLKIEDGKVKVAFVMDDGSARTDEVELKDAFCPDFSFYCK